MKGISTIIATIILAVITIGLTTIAYLYLAGLINQSTQSKPVDICENLCKQEGYDGWEEKTECSSWTTPYYSYYNYNNVNKGCICLRLKNCVGVDNRTFCRTKEEIVYNEVEKVD